MKKTLFPLLLIAALGAGCRSAETPRPVPAPIPAPVQTAPQAVAPTPTPEPTPVVTDEEIQKITVNGGAMYFKPNTLSVKKGVKVQLTFINDGGLHDFVIDELGVKTSKVQSGQTTVVEFTPDKTGAFEYYCSVGSHRAMGMKGTITVTE